MFRNVGSLAACEGAGRTHFCSIRKVPSQASTAGWWVDLSMAAGNPKPQYYASAPLEFATLDGFDGIFHGDNKAPKSKYLTHLGLMSPNAAMVGEYKLLDFIGYYPFIDGDSLEEQTLDNTVTLPRYTDGDGVMVMMVNSAPAGAASTFTFNYTDHAGVDRTSPVLVTNAFPTNIASLATGQAGSGPTGHWALPLAGNSRGVRKINSVQFSVAAGGLFALVLAKPIASLAIREVNTMAEKEFVSQFPGPPKIEDGAYLNLITNCSNTVASQVLVGYAKFAWSE